FKYDWKKESWLIIFAFGILLGGFLGGFVFRDPNPIQISAETTKYLGNIGIKDFSGLAPADLFNFHSLLSVRGFLLMVVGGLFVGFGTRYANGCTSGHAIMGISNLQWPSLVATICFFAGGLLMSWFILPLIIGL